MKAAQVVPMGANPSLTGGGIGRVHAVLFHALENLPRFSAECGVPKDFERMSETVPNPFQGLHA